ncbi:hypothetical protein D3C81_1503780 [compost metagenome]
MLASSTPRSSAHGAPAAPPMVASRSCTCGSSTNTSRMPVSVKSSSAVSSVRLATGRSPRAASTANAVATMVPPTQKPSTLILSCPLMSRATSIARMAACSM